jgi:outer membrane protein TolC
MRLKQQISACFRPVAIVALGAFLFEAGHAVSAFAQPSTRPGGSLGPGSSQQPPAAAPVNSQGPTLSVTVEEAVKLALQNNLGLEAERLSPQAAAFGVAQARAAYVPNLFSTTTKSSSDRPPSDFLSGTGDVITSGATRTNVGIGQNVPWGGGQYQVSFLGTRSTTSSQFATFNPNLGASLDATYVQPLLRGFKIDGFRQQLQQARNTEEIADIELRQRVTQVARATRSGYYNLVSAISGLELANQSLELSRELLRNNQRKVEIGTMAPIDITEAEAEVARLEESVIVAESQIRSAEDALRMLVLNPSQTDFWATRLVPAEQPTLEPRPIDVEGAVTNALQNRTDLSVFKKRLESTDISMSYLRNEKLPEVNLQANYGVIGVGGTQFDWDYSTFTVRNQTQRSFADALRDVFGNDFRTWSLQLVVRYPVGTSQADAALAEARLQRQQQTTNIREAEMRIAAEVREAGRQVTTSLQRVQSTRKARELSERRLQAEEKRLAVGLSDTFRVFQTQRDLSAAKSSELRAILDYNRALVNFEAVQVVPLAGGQ